MKIYKKIVIDIKTLEEIEEVSEEYEGSIALCSGGGGQSGKVELPKEIMYTFNHIMYHNRAVFGGGNDMPGDIIAAKADNPFTNVNALSPSTELAAIDTEIGLYNTLIGALAEKTDWASMMTTATTTIGTAFESVSPNAAVDIAGAWIDPEPASESEIAADVDAYEAIVDDRVEMDALPRFQRGMQNIGAVMSSAFVLGQAIIEGMADRDVAKYQGELRVAAFTKADEIRSKSRLDESNRLADAHIQDDQISVAQAEQKNKMFMLSVAQMLQYFMRRIDGELQVSGLIIEANKMRIIAEGEEAAENITLDESERVWNFTIWQHAANMLAAPSGAAMVPKTHMTRTESALAGGAAGGATGYMTTNSWQGAVVGGIGGLLYGYFGY